MDKSVSKSFLVAFIIFMMIGSLSPATAQRELEIKLANEYYHNGELEKALTLYESILRNYRYIPQVHNNYFSLLLDLKKFDEAHKYLTNVLKRFPGNIYYVLDRGIIYREEGKIEELDRYYRNRQLVDYSIHTYRVAREYAGNPVSYSFELANIYRLLNKKDLMVEEYLTYLSENPSNLQYVRNTLQMILNEPEDLENLEILLYQKIQNDPDNATYNELLIWVNLQQKNFNGAFIQARALDRRSGTAGDRAMNIGIIALENNDYQAAARIFDYIVKVQLLRYG